MRRAIARCSWSRSRIAAPTGPNNERLEFLGDSVLNLLLSERLYREFPMASEGDLSRLRARLVSEEPLAEIAQAMQLGELLLLGSGELKTGGFRRQSILADAFEALCGALYLDGGLEVVRATIGPMFEARIAGASRAFDAQGREDALAGISAGQWSRTAACTPSSAPAASRMRRPFSCPASWRTPALETEGEGPSRRRAEQVAAQAALRALGVHE